MTTQNGSIELGLGGRTAIVTGASSGLGAAVARALAAGGANVVAVGRDGGRLEDTVRRIDADGGSSLPLVEDVTVEGAAQRVVAAAVEAYGELDVVIPNAGVFNHKPLADVSREEIDAVMAVNFRAPFELTQAALPHLREGSAIVFVGSNLVHGGGADMALYTASKGAVEVLARTLAIELGPRGIRVNSVSPGPTRTPMTAGLWANPQLKAMTEAGTPIGRLGEATDIAAAVCYLASTAAAGYVSGATLVIDGGRAAT